MPRAVKFATGKYSWALCDICGLRYRYVELKPTTIRGARTGLRVCDICFDPDHPQNFLDKFVTTDPQALQHARPQIDLEASRRLFPSNIWLKGQRPDLEVQEKLLTAQAIEDSNRTIETDWENQRFRWANQRVQRGERP